MKTQLYNGATMDAMEAVLTEAQGEGVLCGCPQAGAVALIYLGTPNHSDHPISLEIQAGFEHGVKVAADHLRRMRDLTRRLREEAAC